MLEQGKSVRRKEWQRQRYELCLCRNHHSLSPCAARGKEVRKEVEPRKNRGVGVNWDLSRFPRPLKNNGERSRDNIGQLFQYPGMNPQRLMCIQVEQQVPNKFRVSWEFIIPPVTVFQHRALGVPGPITGVKDRQEGSIKLLCFVYVPICERFPISLFYPMAMWLRAKLYMPSMMSYGMEYPFGQLGSAVQSSCAPPAYSLVEWGNTTNQQCALVVIKANYVLGYFSQKFKETDYSSLFDTVEAAPGALCTVLVSPVPLLVRDTELGRVRGHYWDAVVRRDIATFGCAREQ
ncbi:hypothetical protein QYF61_027603 [Mycteria americana]|uniref:Uncharacterized protein n=1 Tax=Mycteria americana TaxID=33587 RepID=A0AAN7NCI7_MYCAM|nr:hypothetical protein QYF61_027603 [Mycteria americana]